MISPLTGIRVLDLSRILAGPSATQLLGDLGADVVKVEKPGAGDDTRQWGPPYVTRPDNSQTGESGYYLSCNRNKRSIAIDIAHPEGQALIRDLATKADILIENFKTGTMARYGLSYAELSALNPGLIYCSLTGFGQSGPRANEAGYDFLIQGLGGIMSITGDADGMPMKVGVAVADLMTGMYAATGILAALHRRNQSGKGDYLDLALFDTQLAWLSNAGQYYLTGGTVPPRLGNAHPMIVPYQVFAVQDGHIILAIGNDGQFAKFCAVANCPELATMPEYQTNPNRVKHRAALIALLTPILLQRSKQDWISSLTAANVPCGAINNIAEALQEPQAIAREMVVTMAHSANPAINLLGNPLKFQHHPVSYRLPPPMLGEHSDAVLEEWLGLDETARQNFRTTRVID